jgi:molybdenum cofactor guanylyltransferase
VISIEEVSPTQVSVAILAGGQGRRMGGDDKGLLDFKGKPLIEHILGQLIPQTEQILINANRNLERYRCYGYPVIVDEKAGFHGPLSGIASVLESSKTPFLLTVPCDAPMLEPNYLKKMIAALQNKPDEPVVAADGKRLQPVYLLVGKQHQESINQFIEQGNRAIKDWLQGREYQSVEFPEKMFENINFPQQLDYSLV